MTKHFLQSKTILFNLIVAVVPLALQLLTGHNIINTTEQTALLTVGNMGLRLITNTQIKI